MKKEYLILLVAGVILVCLLKANKNTPAPANVIKPGDKGNDVLGLQNVISSVTGLKFNTPGAYDNDTLNAVRYYLQGTSALIDREKGYVNQQFAKDLYYIQNNLKQ